MKTNRPLWPALTELFVSMLVFWLEVRGQSPPMIDSNPPVGELVEGRPWRLQCTFDVDGVISISSHIIVDGDPVNLAVPETTIPIPNLNASADRSFATNPNRIIYTVDTVAVRVLNGVNISCLHTVRVGNGTVSFISTVTVVVRYGPRNNMSEVLTECVNVSTISGDQTVRLNASGIFEDPGNPPSVVQWTRNDMPVNDGASGIYRGILSQTVTRADHNKVIVANYSNEYGFTMQRFNICVKSIPEVPSSVTCSRIVNGYDCSWNPPIDNGGYKITHYNVGHSRGTDRPQDLPVKVPSSVTLRVVNTSLEAGVMYVFAVSAVNVLGSGPSGSDSVTTPSKSKAPKNIKVVTLSRVSIQATWDPPPNEDVDFPVIDYLVSLHKEESAPALKSETTNAREQVFDGLKDDTTYWILVSARNAVGFGQLPEFVKGNTLPNGTVGLVSNIEFTKVLDTEFTVQWNPADAGGSNFKIVGYKVDVLKDGEPVKSLESVANQAYVVVGGLMPNTTYEVKIFAANENGYGSLSANETVTTTEPNGGKTTTNIGPIVGGVIAGVVVLAVLVIIAVLYCKHNQDEGSGKSAVSSSRVETGAKTKKQAGGSKITNTQATAGEYARIGESSAISPNSSKTGTDGLQYAELDHLSSAKKGSSEAPKKAEQTTTYADIKHT